MIDKLLLKLRTRDEIGAEEEAALRSLGGEPREIRPNRVIIKANEILDRSILLLDGMVSRFKDLGNGERQIMELHIPGDFLDLHSLTLKRLDHSVLALSHCRYVEVPHEQLEAITVRFPHLTRMLWFSTNLDAAIHREWMLSLGRRTAVARLAHLFCELHVRLGIVELTDAESYRLPLTQTQISECLGLTPVHVNRMLRELRERSLATFKDSIVTIHDPDGLKALAEFTPDYLHLDRFPR